MQGFDVAVAVLNAVNAVLPISVTWVCQNEPEEAHLPVLGRCNLTFDLHVNVPQVRSLVLNMCVRPPCAASMTSSAMTTGASPMSCMRSLSCADMFRPISSGTLSNLSC